MMFDYDNNFYEPSEFEDKTEELKDTLRESVKKEYKDRIAYLENELEKLKDVKDHFEQIKIDYEMKMKECDRAIREAETKAKRERLSELFDGIADTVYGVEKNLGV